MKIRNAVLILWLQGATALYSATPASSPATSETQPASVKLNDLPQNLLSALQEMDAKSGKSAQEARKSLDTFLRAEVERRYRDSYNCFMEGVQKRFLRDETNQAIINDINLFLKPPDQPSNQEKEAIARVKDLVEAGKLDLDTDDPSLWAYQWTHSTGSVEGGFEATGPYCNDFSLREYTIIDMHMAADDLAVGWVSEKIAMPIDLIVKRLSIFMLKPEKGQWRIYSQRGADGPRIYEWLGLKTHLWPDQLEFRVENPAAPTP